MEYHVRSRSLTCSPCSSYYLTTRNLCAVDEYKVKGKNWNAINMTLILQCDQRKQLSYWVLPFSLCLFLIGDWRNDVHTYTCKWIRIKILYLALRHCGLKKLVRNTHQWYHSVLLWMWMKPGKLWILIFFATYKILRHISYTILFVLLHIHKMHNLFEGVLIFSQFDSHCDLIPPMILMRISDPEINGWKEF